MKLAIVVPLPDLARFGYERVADECIGSMAFTADTVYLMQSTRRADNAVGVIGDYGNIRLVSDDRTHFARTPNGDEWFDAYKVMENCNLGMRMAQEDGHDVAACMMCNQYVPNPETDRFRDYCQGIWESNLAWGWVYRMDQLADQLFHASVRVPFIVNLGGPPLRWSTDCIHDGTTIHTMERGDYADMDVFSVVDVQLEVTQEELEAKQNYIRCYHDILPKRHSVYEWGFWFPYYVDKFRKKQGAGCVSDVVGRMIAKRSRRELVSNLILGAL